MCPANPNLQGENSIHKGIVVPPPYTVGKCPPDSVHFKNIQQRNAFLKKS